MTRICQPVSFEEEDLLILNELKRTKNLLSIICRKAIREYKGINPNRELILKKISEAETQKQSAEEELNFYKNQLKQSDIIENQRKSAEQAKEQESKIRALEEEQARHKKHILYISKLFKQNFKIEQDLAIKEAEHYVDYESNTSIDKRVQWVVWLSNKGYKQSK